MSRMKKSLVVLASVAMAPSALAAREVQAPLAGRVTATTYAPGGGVHNAVDIFGGVCGQTPVRTGVVGSLAWTVAINSTVTTCGSSQGGQTNEARHAFATGWTFRLRVFLQSAQSRSRTCDRCEIGTAYVFMGSAQVDPLHLQYDKLGTRDTQWYTGHTTQGETLSLGERVGILD